MHVLIATDGSQAAVHAARYATDAFAPDRVTLLTVLTRLPGENVEELDEAGTSLEDQSRQWEVVMREADRELARTASVAASPHVDTCVEAGDVAQTVVRIAEERGIDLVVLGAHGRRHAFHKSIAERVVRSSPCTVLVVRGESG